MRFSSPGRSLKADGESSQTRLGGKELLFFVELCFLSAGFASAGEEGVPSGGAALPLPGASLHQPPPRSCPGRGAAEAFNSTRSLPCVKPPGDLLKQT